MPDGAGEVLVPRDLVAALTGVFALGARMPRREVQALLEVSLERLRAGMPAPSYQEAVRADADLWAAWAAPHELEAYLEAIMVETAIRPLPPALVKRLMVALWAALGDEDRQRFLERADPDGTFRRRA